VSEDLLDVSTHFRFGENWANYAELVDERRIKGAEESVKTLIGDLEGRSFLDIGSGSGLFSVAALRLGASEVLAIDIDPDSVATTRKLLSHEPAPKWRAEQRSVFDLPTRTRERFDVVYSWGVLHHTGAMWRALDCACAMVKPGGVFAFALYERTPLCRPWTYEKRLYRRLPKAVQKLFRGVYLGAWGAGMMVKGHNPWRYVREGQKRGMDVFHDVHDWMGGYPYESTTPAEVEAFMSERGFKRQKVVPWRILLAGLFGSGCTEYVFRRQGSGDPSPLPSSRS
jgi:2-polyprenyl-6-hydroxyphenyl methylase/3-demethylubiquinone-9 3-methyltransferase